MLGKALMTGKENMNESVPVWTSAASFLIGRQGSISLNSGTGIHFCLCHNQGGQFLGESRSMLRSPCMTLVPKAMATL